MKFKKLMLVTLVLLAVLTIGAVSAADDAGLNEKLAVDDAGEVSVDASLDENAVFESGDEEIVAAFESDVVSDGNSSGGSVIPVDDGGEVIPISDGNSTSVEENDDGSHYLYINAGGIIINDDSDYEYNEEATIAGIILDPHTENGTFSVYNGTQCVFNAPIGAEGWHIDDNGNLKYVIQLVDFPLYQFADDDEVKFTFLDGEGREIEEFTRTVSIRITDEYMKFYSDFSTSEDYYIYVNDEGEFDTSIEYEEYDGDAIVGGIILHPETMEGRFVILDGDKEIFSRNIIGESDEWHFDDDGNLKYVVYFYELNLTDVENEDAITLAFYDSEGIEDTDLTKHVKIQIEDDIVKFINDENDADDGVIIYIDNGDECNYTLSNEDNLAEEFALVSVRDDLNGNITIFVYDDENDEKIYFLNKELNEFKNMTDYDNEGFTLYLISFNDLSDLNEFKNQESFTLAFFDVEGNKVDSRDYSVEYDDEEDIISFWEVNENGEDDEDDEPFINQDKIITNDDDENYNPDVIVATYKDNSIRRIVIARQYSGIALFNKTIDEEDFQDGCYNIYLKDLKLNAEDRDVLTFTCYNQDDDEMDEFTGYFVIKVRDDFIQLFEFEEFDEIEFYSFYGNLTTGDLNDPELMGWHPNGNFIQVVSPFELKEINVSVNGNGFTKTYTIEDMIDAYNPDGNYIYSIGGYSYVIRLNDEIVSSLPENEILIFNYICDDLNITQKRIRQEDYLYKAITPDDIATLFIIDVADELHSVNDVAVSFNATFYANRQSIYIELGGGFFSVYVNDTKVEDLGRFVRIDDETELELFRLCGHEHAWPELCLTLADLGITEEGDYNIKVTHYPDDNDEDEEYFIKAETEVINKNITYKPIPKPDSSISLEKTVFDYAEEIFVNVTLTGATECEGVVIDYHEGPYVAYDEGVYLRNFNAGNYTIQFTTVPDENHSAVVVNVNITINKVDSSISLDNTVFDYAEEIFVNVTLVGANECEASVVGYPEGPAYVSYDDEGVYLRDFDAGNYTIQFTTIPDENHNEVVVNVNITINKAISSLIDVDVAPVYYGEPVVVNVRTPSDATGLVNVEVLGISYNSQIVNGMATVSISGLNAGLYTVSLNYSGDIKYGPYSTVVNASVLKADSSISLDNTVFDYAEEIFVNVTLVGANECEASVVGYPEGPAYVSYDDEGVYLRNFNAGNYTIQFTTNPDENHNAVVVNVNVTINKVDSSIDLNDTVFDYGQNIIIPVSSNGATTLNIAVDGYTGFIACSVDENLVINGINIINGLNAGSYTLNVTTVPDENHNAVTKIATITINKINPSVELSDNSVEFYYGENGNIGIIIIGNGVELDEISVVDHPEAAIFANADGIVISNLTVGSYVLSVTTKENENYNAITQTANVTVKRAVVTNDNFNYFIGEDGKLTNDWLELVFKGEFTGKSFIIDKPVILIGENAVFKDSTFDIVSDNVTIENMKLNYGGTGNYVINVVGASNFNLNNNVIEFNAKANNCYAVKVNNSHVVSIVDNNIRVKGVNYNVDGILISDSSYTVISNELYVDAAQNANGINIIGSTNGTVEDNNLDVKANKTAIGINGNTTSGSILFISHNVLLINALKGIGILDDSVGVINNYITVVGDSGTAIVVNSNNTEVKNNVIVVDTSNDELESTGIEVNNDEVTITNNNVASSGSSVLLKGSNAKVSQNDLKGKIIVSSNQNELKDNTIDSKDDHAIILVGSASGNTITTNVLSSAGGKGDAAISNVGTGVNTIVGNKFKPELDITPIADVFEGQGVVIIIKAEENFTATVNVQVGSFNTTASLTNGTGKVTIAADKLSVGKTDVKVTFAGNEQYADGTANATFTVKANVATVINVAAVTTTYGTSKNIVVTLTDANGNALAGKTVTVVFNGASKTLTTDGKGQATLAIGTKLVPKTYSASVTFDGDVGYAKSAKSVNVVVKKATPKLTAKKKTFKVKKPKKYTVTLKTDKNKALNKAKIVLTVKVNGKKVKITKTTKKGKATFNLKKLTKKGKFTATVKFAGNKYFKAVTKKVKLTVK